jgi:hypothetical protein
MILAGAAAVMSAIGSVQAGQAQRKMANYNARVAEDTARSQGERQQDQVRRQMASARVAIGKSGVAVSGSPLDVLADSAAQAELDHQTILRQGAAQAGMDRYKGSMASRQGYFGAATSLLSSASKMAGGLSFGGGGDVNAPSRYGLGDGTTFSLGNASALANYDWQGFRV